MTKEEKQAYMKAYNKTYRKTHKEELRAYEKARASDEKRRSYRKEYMKEYTSTHKEQCNANHRKYAHKATRIAENEIFTDMYKFPEDVNIIDSKHVEYKGTVYHIVRNGYLQAGAGKRLHVEIAKDMGIWFEGCDVHHIDLSVFNNDRSNLCAITPEKHRKIHSSLRRKA